MCCVCNADLTVRGAMVLIELTPLLVAAVCSATQEKRVWFIPLTSLSVDCLQMVLLLLLFHAPLTLFLICQEVFMTVYFPLLPWRKGNCFTSPSLRGWDFMLLVLFFPPEQTHVLLWACFLRLPSNAFTLLVKDIQYLQEAPSCILTKVLERTGSMASFQVHRF